MGRGPVCGMITRRGGGPQELQPPRWWARVQVLLLEEPVQLRERLPASAVRQRPALALEQGLRRPLPGEALVLPGVEQRREPPGPLRLGGRRVPELVELAKQLRQEAGRSPVRLAACWRLQELKAERRYWPPAEAAARCGEALEALPAESVLQRELRQPEQRRQAEAGQPKQAPRTVVPQPRLGAAEQP